MAPAQLCRQRRHNLLIGKALAGLHGADVRREVSELVSSMVEAGTMLPLLEDQLLTLVEAAQRRGIAAIIGQDAALALSLRADGVEIEADPAAYTAARAKLGASAITGAQCGTSRHNAMTLGEAGADYVGLASTPGEELISWWSGLFEVPCVCINELSLEDAPAVIRAGADFVRPDPSMWQSPDAARRMVDSFNRLIAEHAP